jgi:hypothetical protein
MNNARKSTKLTLNDGFDIRRALIDYVVNAEEDDIRLLKEELEQSRPEINNDVLRIGPWAYEEETNSIVRHLPPDKLHGYDYQAHLLKEANNWKVVSISRIEVFVK